jgi:hypothetical protein
MTALHLRGNGFALLFLMFFMIGHVGLMVILLGQTTLQRPYSIGIPIDLVVRDHT